MALATSNLRVSSIINVLGVSSTKRIFYNADGSAKTLAQLSQVVNKWGLNSSYNNGLANPDDKLNYLFTQRRLSCFKGYDHFAEEGGIT